MKTAKKPRTRAKSGVQSSVAKEIALIVGQNGKRGKSRAKPGKALMKFAGKAVGLPPDAARNLDHYLYGRPKR